MMMVPTRILPLLTTSLLGWRTKLRMGMELLRAPRPKPGDESVADFIQEHYGAERWTTWRNPCFPESTAATPAS